VDVELDVEFHLRVSGGECQRRERLGQVGTIWWMLSWMLSFT
jgi:hypothetical protein